MHGAALTSRQDSEDGGENGDGASQDFEAAMTKFRVRSLRSLERSAADSILHSMILK